VLTIKPTQTPRACPRRLFSDHRCVRAVAQQKAVPCPQRSLLIWAADTELVLIKRLQPTHQQAATHRDSLTELDKLARIRRLSSDPELCAEVEPLRPVVSYTTDGSHKAKCTYAHILTPYKDLADKGEGAGGIVLMPDEH
jgi:hypothetical protein